MRQGNIQPRDIINADDRALIHQLCLGEIKKFGYSFEGQRKADVAVVRTA